MTAAAEDLRAPDARTVAVHPERTGDPTVVRWLVAGGLPARFDAEPLRALVADGVLASTSVGPDHVATTIAAGRSWSADGAAVRWGVQQAVATGRARDGEASSADPDGALAQVAARILAEDVAPYAAGHGGSIVLADVCDGVVDVELTGACHGCPAAAFTVQGRIERRLRAEAPWLAAVRVLQPRHDS